MHNQIKCKLPGGGIFGYTHVANILVVTINLTINVKTSIREFESMIILYVQNCVLIAKY